MRGTGSTLKFKPGKGEHVFTAVADDGTSVVEDGFVVIVKEGEVSPGPGLVTALADVVPAALVQFRRRP